MIESGLAIGLKRELSHNSGKTESLNVTDFNEKYIVHTYYKSGNIRGNVKRFLAFLREKSNAVF